MDIKKIIEENPTLSITLKGNDLIDFAESIAKNAAKQALSKHSEKLYTRAEIIEKFKISSPTLWRWEKAGLIESRKIGNKKFYPESMIKELLK